MSQENLNPNDSIKFVSRELVSQFAIEEIDLFDDLFAQSQIDPARLTEKKHGDDPLEFGFDEILITYTPAIVGMVTLALNKLSQMILQTLQGETEGVVQKKTKEVFQRVLQGKTNDPYQSEFMTFSEKELEELYKLGVQEGIAYGLPAKDAAKIMARLTLPITRIQRK